MDSSRAAIAPPVRDGCAVQSLSYGEPSYALTRRLPAGDFDAVVDRVKQALSAQGFGVLTEIDVQQTLKNKLDVDVSRYRILGACNPSLAHQALSAAPGVGVLLPCNVVVAEEPAAIVVSAVDPERLFAVVQDPDVEPIARQVRERLGAVMAALT